MSHHLSSVSDECLSLISGYLMAHDLAHLHFCGSTSLNHRLSRAVKRFHLKYTTRSAPVWPLLIKHYSSLQTLHLEGNHVGLNGLFVRNIDYRIIASTIQEMNLSFANGLLSLITLPSPSLCRAKFKPKLRFNILERFPHLSSLQWGNSYGSAMEKWDFSGFLSQLDGDDTCPLGILDASLLSGIGFSAKLPRKYPRHLHGLKIGMSDWKGFTLPLYLTHLTLRWSGWEHLLPDLPTTLVSLQVHSLYPIHNWIEWKQKWAELLRLANLKEFAASFHHINPTVMSCVPPSVRSLTLGSTYFASDSLAHLPHALETLHILSPLSLGLDDVYSRAAEKMHEEEERMKSQAANQSSIKSSTDEHNAPESISTNHGELLRESSMDIDIPADASYTSCAQLPSTLTDVSGSVLPLHIPILWKTFPRGLQRVVNSTNHAPSTLHFEGEMCEDVNSLPDSFDRWSIHTTSKAQMRKISIEPTSIEVLIDKEDPSPETDFLEALIDFHALKSLSVTGTMLLQLSPINHFKSALQSLTLKFPTNGRVEFEDIDFSLPWARHLETLVITFQIHDEKSCAKWLGTLPPHLTSFTCDTIGPTSLLTEPLPSDVLLNLPPSLTKLVISVKDLTAKHLTSLPKKLQLATIRGSVDPALVPEDLKLLPKMLSDLSIPETWANRNDLADWIRQNTNLNYFDCVRHRCQFLDFNEVRGTPSASLSLAIEETNRESPEEPQSSADLPPPRRTKRTTRNR